MINSMGKQILNREQIQAHQEAARLKNPNRQKIEELRTELHRIAKEISDLTSDDEKYLNILMFLSMDFDSREAAIKCMENSEIGEHLSNIFFTHAENEFSESILLEAAERLGYQPGMDEEGETNT